MLAITIRHTSGERPFAGSPTPTTSDPKDCPAMNPMKATCRHAGEGQVGPGDQAPPLQLGHPGPVGDLRAARRIRDESPQGPSPGRDHLDPRAGLRSGGVGLLRPAQPAQLRRARREVAALAVPQQRGHAALPHGLLHRAPSPAPVEEEGHHPRRRGVRAPHRVPRRIPGLERHGARAPEGDRDDRAHHRSRGRRRRPVQLVGEAAKPRCEPAEPDIRASG